MRTSSRLLALLILLGFWASQAIAADKDGIPPLPPAAALTADEQKRIEDAIAELATIERPDFGLSDRIASSAFPAVEGAQGRSYVMTGGFHFARLPALVRLVKTGPVAIPALLKHLDDATPTKLVIKHEVGIGGMWYEAEVHVNCFIEEEVKASEKAGLKPEQRGHGKDINEHTVSVGDVCFVILGMITNRSYNAVRYQPTGCTVINSPTTDPRIATAVRAIWNVPDAREELYRRLWVDYRTHGRKEGTEMWYWWASQVDHGAATRLLYYFREQAVPTFIERLKGINDSLPKADMPKKERDHLNWELSGFIYAVSWSDDERIHEQLGRIARRSDSENIIYLCTKAMIGHADDEYFAKLSAMLLNSDHEGDSSGLLSALLTVYGKRAIPVFKEYLSKGGEEAGRNVVSFVWRGNCPGCELEVLAPLLSDRRKGLGTYYLDGKDRPKGELQIVVQDEKPPTEAEMRLCDNAYMLINWALGRKDVRCSGSAEDMDGGIEVLRKELTAREQKPDAGRQ